MLNDNLIAYMDYADDNPNYIQVISSCFKLLHYLKPEEHIKGTVNKTLEVLACMRNHCNPLADPPFDPSKLGEHTKRSA